MKFNNIPTLENMGQSEVVDLEFVDTACPEADLTDGEADMIEQGAEISDLNDGFDAAEGAVDSVDEVKEVLSEDISGEASRTELATVECLLNSIHSTLGIERQTISLEHYSFMSKSELVDTLEENKQGILSRLATGIMSLINTIIGFIASLLRNRTLLVKHIEGLKTRVNNYVDGSNSDRVPSKFKDFAAVQEGYKSCNELINAGNKQIERLDTIKEAIKKDDFNAFQKYEGADTAELARSEFAGGDKVKVQRSGKVAKLEFIPGNITEGIRLNKSEMHRTLELAIKTVDGLKAFKSTENRVVASGRILKDALLGFYHGVRAKRSADKDNADDTLYHSKQVMIRMATMEYRAIAVSYGYKTPSVVFKNARAMADYVKSSLSTR